MFPVPVPAGPHRRPASTGRELEEYCVAAVPTDSGVVTVELPGSHAPVHATLVVTVTELDPTRASVRIAGELDLAVVDLIADVLDGQIAAGHADVVLDVSDLAFCSCAGLGTLMASGRRFTAAGGALTLVGSNDCVERLVRLTEPEGIPPMVSAADGRA